MEWQTPAEAKWQDYLDERFPNGAYVERLPVTEDGIQLLCPRLYVTGVVGAGAGPRVYVVSLNGPPIELSVLVFSTTSVPAMLEASTVEKEGWLLVPVPAAAAKRRAKEFAATKDSVELKLANATEAGFR